MSRVAPGRGVLISESNRMYSELLVKGILRRAAPVSSGRVCFQYRQNPERTSGKSASGGHRQLRSPERTLGRRSNITTDPKSLS